MRVIVQSGRWQPLCAGCLAAGARTVDISSDAKYHAAGGGGGGGGGDTDPHGTAESARRTVALNLAMSAGAGSLPLPATDVRRRVLAAGCIGNLVEWHDFALYGAFAPVIATTFFPGPDRIGGLAATFGVFGVAFVARPAGALVFGHYGDRFGRRRALVVGILLMAVVTAGIGVTPVYATVGWPAPALLTVLRLVQGVAVGGEYSGSAALIVEYAPDDLRG